MTSVDPDVPFSEKCQTVAVNAHGCGLISPKPLDKGTVVKLGLLPENREAMARVADVVKLGEDGRTWLLGLQLDRPENVWGVRMPPHDWAKAIEEVAQDSEAVVAAPAMAAAAAAGASPAASVATVTAAVTAPPEFPVVTIVAPEGSAATPVAQASASVAEPAAIAKPKPSFPSDNGNSGARTEDTSRSNGHQAAAPAYPVRERDWVELRKSLQDHLQDIMWQMDDQVEAKLERWKEQMVDAEARLDSLCQLQDRLQAHLTVLSEIVKEKVRPEGEEASSEKDGGEDKAQGAQPAPAAAESAGTVVSQEEIRQLQQWMQSLIHLLPQAVEQHANEAVGAAEERLHAVMEEQVAQLKTQVSELQAGIEQKLSSAAAAREESGAQQEAKDKAAEEALRKAGEKLSDSLQKRLQAEFERLQDEVKKAQQAAEAESERLQRLQEELAAKTALQAAESASRAEELKQASENLLRETSERISSELRTQVQTELEPQRQRLQEAMAAIEEKAAALHSQITQAASGAEETLNARESLESMMASLTQAASQQLKEDVGAALQKISTEAHEQATRLEKEVSERSGEAQQIAAAVQEQLAALQKQANEISARMVETSRAQQSMQSLVDAAIATANQKLEQNAAGALERVRSQSEEQFARIQQQVTLQGQKLEELARQRQQETQALLEQHMHELRGTSERMLRKVSEELSGSLNLHLKKEFEGQRQAWEKQREASQAEKAWVEARANELAGRWEGRLQGYIERATGDAVSKLRDDVEKAASDIIHSQMAEVQSRLNVSLEPLLARAENTEKGLEKLLSSAQQESHRNETQRAALERQRDDLQGWLEQQMERLRQAVHDAVTETSGEIKGRIHMAVEMAREPIEQRSREAQKQLEELAARKSREVTDRLADFEKAMEPRLKAHLAETVESFEKNTASMAEKSVHRCQDEMADTLDSMLRLLRSKREAKQ